MYLKTLIYSLPKNPRSLIMKIAYYLQTIIWYLTNKPIPTPHLIKIKTILKYAKGYKILNFIETGTYFGETVDATKKYFNQVYSIELNKEQYQITKKMFSKEKNIKIIRGDSALILPKLLAKINEPYLFWLDAHSSEGFSLNNSPIMQEITAISKNKIKKHVILIDDARCFKENNSYKEMKTFIKKKLPNYKIDIKMDIIRVCPT